MNIIMQGMVVLKEQIFYSSTLGWCGGLERTKSTHFFLDLACMFCMLHGFQEPSRPTATEAEADSPWNPEESPARNRSVYQRIHQLC